MGWTWTDRVVKPVVKRNGECFKKSQWKNCPYWTVRHKKSDKAVIEYRCILFDKVKDASLSLPECNVQYGRTYDGKP